MEGKFFCIVTDFTKMLLCSTFLITVNLLRKEITLVLHVSNLILWILESNFFFLFIALKFD